MNREKAPKLWINATIVMMVVALLFFYFIQWDDVKQEVIKRVTQESAVKDAYRPIPQNDASLLDAIRQAYPLNRFEEQLAQLKMRNRENYQKVDLVERVALDRELALLEAKQNNSVQAYQLKLDLLVTVIRFIENIRKELATKKFNTVQTSLINGDTRLASSLLSDIHNKYRVTLGGESYDREAQAVHLQGKIAREQLDFQRSYQYHRLSVKYDPQNTRYLLAAADVADSLALYRNAIIYYEAALHNLRQNDDTPKGQLRSLLTKLAKAWESRANGEKAREYYQQAAAIPD